MASLIVRKIEDTLVRKLRECAASEGISMEEAHRRILRNALLKKRELPSFKEYLQMMPELPKEVVSRRRRVSAKRRHVGI